MKNDEQTAVLGGGCFWCVAAIFQRIDGITSVTSGYAGGNRDNPGYEQVCAGLTGHAEVVKIDFDSSVIDFEKILDIFFLAHDPTTLNRQGADIGTQYRSIILYQNDQQKKVAEKKINDLNRAGIYKKEIVTEVKALDHFWPAEVYHQDYYEKHPFAGYCRVVILPKITKMELPKIARILNNHID